MAGWRGNQKKTGTKKSLIAGETAGNPEKRPGGQVRGSKQKARTPGEKSRERTKQGRKA